MLGLISGTSEGKDILIELNKFTDNIFVSTATEYGGNLLREYKYKVLNQKPLDIQEIIETININGIKGIIDATHPYATEVSKNIMEACKHCEIKYIRYERPSLLEKYKGYSNVHVIYSYDELRDKLTNIGGNILNTTGSKSIKSIMALNLNNRIIHRVLPTLKVMQELDEVNIEPENIVAIKGPISTQLNEAFIEEFQGKVMLTKDSGERGGLEEKILSCIEKKIDIFIIARKKMNYPLEFNDIIELTEYIRRDEALYEN